LVRLTLRPWNRWAEKGSCLSTPCMATHVRIAEGQVQSGEARS
jgi:hypothetical protein